MKKELKTLGFYLVKVLFAVAIFFAVFAGLYIKHDLTADAIHNVPEGVVLIYAVFGMLAMYLIGQVQQLFNHDTKGAK